MQSWIFITPIFITIIFITSLLQSSVSHDPSEIILICWFAAQEIFITIINVENSYLIFCGNHNLGFSGFLHEYKV